MSDSASIPAPDATPALAVCGIHKAFAAPVLSDVSIAFHAGEIHALMGMNGAGKSTLMRMLAGVLAPDQGVIEVAGRPCRFRDPAAALDAGIAMVYQELDLVPHLSVAQNVLLGDEPVHAGGRLDRTAARRRVTELLQACGIALDPDRPVRALRTGERQLVAIAKAYARARSVLILDEPTSALNAGEVDHLFTVLRRLRGSGLALIYISHRLDEIDAIADRVTVLRNGRVVYSAVGRTNREAVVEAMLGRAVEALAAAPHTAARQEALLELRGLSAPPAFAEINLTLHAGEVLALAGLVGDGRGALADALFGLLPPHTGEILLQGAAITLNDSHAAVAHGIGFIPEDRARGLCPQLSAGTNATLASVPRFANWWRRQIRVESTLAQTSLAQAGVDPALAPRAVRKLSGGTQQKTLLARWIAAASRVLILNEPTRGVDIGSRIEIYRQIEQWCREGRGMLLISSDLDEILRIAQRVLVMRRGKIVAELTGHRLTRENILLAAAPATD
ncbi:MAG: sugar ABC transporter ATP-binding protein [Terriglobales bacterium]